jgi:hypothetical protein
LIVALLITLSAPIPLPACPFCPTVEPTFAECRDGADWVGLVEVADDIDANAQSKTCRVRTRQLIKGETRPVD